MKIRYRYPNFRHVGTRILLDHTNQEHIPLPFGIKEFLEPRLFWVADSLISEILNPKP